MRALSGDGARHARGEVESLCTVMHFKILSCHLMTVRVLRRGTLSFCEKISGMPTVRHEDDEGDRHRVG
jgi:hypothetical protein